MPEISHTLTGLVDLASYEQNVPKYTASLIFCSTISCVPQLSQKLAKLKSGEYLHVALCTVATVNILI